VAYFPGVRRDGDDARRLDRWSDFPPGDPHRDVTGALHDVSNALTVLLGWISEVKSGVSPADRDRAMSIIEDRARSARDLARRAIGAHDAVDERERPVGAVVHDVVEALSVEAVRAKVTVQVSGGGAGTRMPLAADASQVLTNVVMNALAWAPPGSRVTVDVLDDDGSGIALVVTDEGPGITAGQVDRIFAGSSSREGGAGVGLKHARAVARAAGGDLSVVHRTEGSGARFRIDWPRSAGGATEGPVSTARSAVLAGQRVLVVEDDVGVAMLLETALGARGARVVVARTAAELETLAAEEHDAALVDLSPIAHDVQGAIDMLRRGSPDLAIVFISGSSVRLPDALEDERIRWVRKPFEVKEIVAALAEGT
jgi:CheY-like chemotaxis protein